MAATAELVADVIGRGVAELLDWEEQLGRDRLPRVDGKPCSTCPGPGSSTRPPASEARCAGPVAAAPRCRRGNGSSWPRPASTRRAPSSGSTSSARAGAWVQLTFLRDPAGGWAVAVRHSTETWHEVAVFQVRVGYAAPKAIKVVGG